ncbi:TetR/AcrR family transcriptional regulator [Actinomadura oligospora]|uniref:TetR/AcrR family transcriptional regulator n=1 Tax=Actinomadura oligospora TaxID=111804 RepID=UPI0004798A20|nr:TetR/AcrR family transcriptional regulator [Actinomadura oligospora]
MTDRRRSILEAATRSIARDGVRGLRVERLAAEAGVSTTLLYYYFKDRAGLLRQTLEFVSDRASHYTTEDRPRAATAREELEQTLLLELQDVPAVQENSTAWGELRASAVFDEDLQEQLRDATRVWVEEIAELVTQASDHADPVAAAERLTAFVEGLSQRWLSGTLTLDRARDLMRDAIAVELG